MSEGEEAPDPEDFATLFASVGAEPALELGQIVKGRIIQIGAETIFVDVHGKGEALIARGELEDAQGRLGVGVGDEIEATVISTGDEVRLSHKLLKGTQAREALEVAAQAGLPVEGKVTAVIKGGYEVMVGGLRAFCPFSQMELHRVDSPETFLRRTLEFRITRYSENGRNIVLSRRQLLEHRAAKAAEETRKTIVPGAILPGTVSSLAAFGAFVDLGGVQGLVPVSEISHSRLGRPADRLHVGQAVTVKVLGVDEGTGRISLSLKALEGDPWTAVPGALRAREVVRGHVVRMTDFGVFVEVLPGVDGLLHLTEIPRSRQGAMKEAAASGAELAVLIVSITTGLARSILLEFPCTLGAQDLSRAGVFLRERLVGLTLREARASIGERLAASGRPIGIVEQEVVRRAPRAPPPGRHGAGGATAGRSRRARAGGGADVGHPRGGAALAGEHRPGRL